MAKNPGRAERNAHDELAEYLEAHADDGSLWEGDTALWESTPLKVVGEPTECLQSLANAKDMNLIEYMEQVLVDHVEKVAETNGAPSAADVGRAAQPGPGDREAHPSGRGR